MDLEKGHASIAEEQTAGFMKAVNQLSTKKTMKNNKWLEMAKAVPTTSNARLREAQQQYGKEDTKLYLGYGSNLAAETFLGKRGIRPLSQVNIVSPEIQLTFDLPGLPYSEPCFANSKYRPKPNEPPEAERPPYHKNAWKKGLVGVVYEVTKEDYAHIIATEGGGSGYHDVLVDCYVLDSDPSKEVPLEPSGNPFKAHTLYAHRAEALRPSPDYAQPSPRYLKLITDGATEHDLPHDYRFFLENIRSFHTTTTKQRLGSFIFLATWGPLLMFFFGGAARIFLRPNGTYPAWFARLTAAIFTATWASYDHFFYNLFGEGERTIGDDVPGTDRPGKKPKHGHKETEGESISEKTLLLTREDRYRSDLTTLSMA